VCWLRGRAERAYIPTSPRSALGIATMTDLKMKVNNKIMLRRKFGDLNLKREKLVFSHVFLELKAE
jgi:hypothetical protein